ncbi:hypothetical protein R3P38DRAFT_3602357 [Favolaschia claudopus]|uniref:Uncharacterized protein n=1 Tax=Favolaschia claudopus TaxID=2862362 RepID=A0AAW0AAV7_9AGAR
MIVTVTSFESRRNFRLRTRRIQAKTKREGCNSSAFDSARCRVMTLKKEEAVGVFWDQPVRSEHTFSYRRQRRRLLYAARFRAKYIVWYYDPMIIRSPFSLCQPIANDCEENETSTTRPPEGSQTGVRPGWILFSLISSPSIPSQSVLSTGSRRDAEFSISFDEDGVADYTPIQSLGTPFCHAFESSLRRNTLSLMPQTFQCAIYLYTWSYSSAMPPASAHFPFGPSSSRLPVPVVSRFKALTCKLLRLCLTIAPCGGCALPPDTLSLYTPALATSSPSDTPGWVPRRSEPLLPRSRRLFWEVWAGVGSRRRVCWCKCIISQCGGVAGVEPRMNRDVCAGGSSSCYGASLGGYWCGCAGRWSEEDHCEKFASGVAFFRCVDDYSSPSRATRR